LGGDLKAAGFQQTPQTRGGDSFAQARDHTARNKDVFFHSRHSPPELRAASTVVFVPDGHGPQKTEEIVEPLSIFINKNLCKSLFTSILFPSFNFVKAIDGSSHFSLTISIYQKKRFRLFANPSKCEESLRITAKRTQGLLRVISVSS
jgi:hypothetical protein